jgi:hypothetical protein
MTLVEMGDGLGGVSSGCDPWAAWSEVMAERFGRVAHRYVPTEVRERAGRYRLGLLDRLERKKRAQEKLASG